MSIAPEVYPKYPKIAVVNTIPQIHREGAPKCVWDIFKISEPWDWNIQGEAEAQGLQVWFQSLWKENEHPSTAAHRTPRAFQLSNTERWPRGPLGPRSAQDSRPRVSSQASPYLGLRGNQPPPSPGQPPRPRAASRSPTLQLPPILLLPPSFRGKAAACQSAGGFKTPSPGRTSAEAPCGD